MKAWERMESPAVCACTQTQGKMININMAMALNRYFNKEVKVKNVEWMTTKNEPGKTYLMQGNEAIVRGALEGKDGGKEWDVIHF